MANKGIVNTVTLIIDGKNNSVSAIKSAEGDITKLSDLIKNTGLSVDSLGGALGKMFAGFSVGWAASELFQFMKGVINTADELYKMSQKTGISVESLSTLRYAADLSGVELESFESSIIKFNKAIYEAEDGSGETAEAFKKLGINLKDSNGILKDAEQLFFETSDKLSVMEDGTQKAALSLKLFSKSGADMIPLLNEGTTGLNKLMQEARNLGIEMSTNTAMQAQMFNDQLTTLKYQAEGIAVEALPGLLDELSEIAYWFQNFNWENFWRVMVLWEEPKGFSEWKKNAAEAAKARNEQLQKQNEINAAKEKEEILTQNQLRMQKALSDGWREQKLIIVNELIGNGIDKTTIAFYQLMNNVEALKEKYKGIPESQKILNSYVEEWMLQNDIMNNTNLPSLLTKMNLLSDKFGTIPAALELANFYADQLAQKAGKMYGSDDVTPTGPERMPGQTNQPIKTLLPLPDMEEIMKRFHIIEARSTEVTAGMTLEFLVLEGVISNSLGNMASAAEMAFVGFGEKNRAFFEAYKAFAVAQALIDTYTSANAAYKAMAGIPFFGPVLAAAAATAAIVYGLGNVGRIASLQPGSRGSGGGSASTPALHIPSYNNSQVINNNTQTDNTKTVTIHIHSYGGYGSDADREVRERLAPAINRAYRDGVFDF